MRVFDQCMTGLVFFHLMMTAILGIKKMPGPAIICAILWLFDAAFWWAGHAAPAASACCCPQAALSECLP